MGWGLLGRANNISNPLASLEDKFETRNTYEGEGGEFSSGNWFSGDTAIFGGAEYHLRKLGLTIKLEYDTSEYDKDTKNPLLVDSRINFGLLFNYSKNLLLFSSKTAPHRFQLWHFFGSHIPGLYGVK